MKIKKFLATVSLSALALINIAPVNQAFADGIQISVPCLRKLERDDQGLIPFCWTKSNDFGTEIKCCSWIITDENRLRSSGVFSEEAVRYLIDNQVQCVTQEYFKNKTGISESLAREFWLGRFGVDVMQSLIKKFGFPTNVRETEFSRGMKNNTITGPNDTVIDPESELDVVAPDDDFEIISLERDENSYVSLIEKFGSTGSLPAELSIGGVVVYYYKGSFGNSSWWGYMITNPDQFENWCKSQGLSQDMIKILVACQNTWIAEVSTLYGDDNIRDVLPPAFVSALESVRDKQSKSESSEEAKTYIAVKETWFTSVIDSSSIRIRSITRQFNRFGISENSRSEFSGGLGYLIRKVFWGNPVTRRIEVLKRNKDISGDQK